VPFARGIGPLELILILVIVMLIFGVGKLPQVGQAVGKAVKQFRQSQESSLEAEGTEEDKVTTEKSD
jgi:sec-independent protein translocase protein TatA